MASEVGGIVDVIKDGETGLLVPEKNPEAIAEAVLRLLNEPEFAQRLGEQGLNTPGIFRLGSHHGPVRRDLPQMRRLRRPTNAEGCSAGNYIGMTMETKTISSKH